MWSFVWALVWVYMVYAVLMVWLVFGRGPFAYAYTPVVGWVLRTLLGRMQYLVIGARCYGPQRGWETVLTPAGRVQAQYRYTDQWRQSPLTFLPRYSYELVRYGHDHAPMEIAARRAGGEPTR